MKRIFPILISTVFILSNFGCTTADDNSNSDNSNSNSSVASGAEPAQSNTDPVAVNEPVPAFTDANIALTEGTKYLDANATEKAVEAYKQAVKLNPDLAEAYFRLGIAYSLLEKEREIAQVADEEPSANTNKKGKKEAVKLTDSEKAFEDAVKAYEKIVEKDPKDDAAQFNLGRSFNKLNKDKEAEKALRQAAKLKPDDTEYQTEFGAILVKLANYDEAVPVLKKAVSLDESNSQAQELLEKAEAGKRRIDFGVKSAQQQMEAARQKSSRGKQVGTEPTGEETPPPFPSPKPTTK